MQDSCSGRPAGIAGTVRASSKRTDVERRPLRSERMYSIFHTPRSLGAGGVLVGQHAGVHLPPRCPGIGPGASNRRPQAKRSPPGLGLRTGRVPGGRERDLWDVECWTRSNCRFRAAMRVCETCVQMYGPSVSLGSSDREKRSKEAKKATSKSLLRSFGAANDRG